MIHANLPHKFWPEAFATACYLFNRVSTKALKGKTSYEAWHDYKSDLSNLRIYDCMIYVLDYKSKGKMVEREWVDTLIDYEAKNQ
jgi:hypothetical protein